MKKNIMKKIGKPFTGETKVRTIVNTLSWFTITLCFVYTKKGIANWIVIFQKKELLIGL